MPTPSPSAARILSRCRELAGITDVPGETTRTYLSPAMHRANTLVGSWMNEAGLAVSHDAAGNLRGLSRTAGPRLLFGSHLDTVRNAGAFDGPLGVLLAIEAAELLASENLPYTFEVIAFAEEEGVRFHQPFLGSLALTGGLGPYLTLRDDAGITLEQALPDPAALSSAQLHPDTFAYLEVHIEQGPVLESENRPITAVSAIAGQSRLRLTFTGQANHAGTTPMHLRHDALAAAAHWMVLTETLVRDAGDGLVATVGSCTVSPGQGNVIPGEAILTLDLRHRTDSVRQQTLAVVLEIAEEQAAARGCTVIHNTLLDQPAVSMDATLTALLASSVESCGYGTGTLVSGAGHDAMILAPNLPSAMLFVRSPGGISHHPAENVLLEDIEAALATVLHFSASFAPSPTADDLA